MDEQTLKLLQRIKNSSDGKDFIEYMQQLSLVNYDSWKREGGEVLRGKAIAFDQIIQLFDTIDEKANIKATNPEWM